MVETLARNWGWVLLRGVVAILFGVLTLASPGITLAMLVVCFGGYALTDGVAMVVSAISRRPGEPRWGALLIGGLLGIGAGLAAVFAPAVTAAALLALVGARAVVVGLAEIVAALRMRREIEGEWMLVASGLLAVGFGTLFVTEPGVGALAVAPWIGGFAVAAGILQISLAFRLRRWGRTPPGPSAPLRLHLKRFRRA